MQLRCSDIRRGCFVRPVDDARTAWCLCPSKLLLTLLLSPHREILQRHFDFGVGRGGVGDAGGGDSAGGRSGSSEASGAARERREGEVRDGGDSTWLLGGDCIRLRGSK